MVSTIDILRSNVNGDQYIWALQSAYAAGVRLYDPSFALTRDANIGEKLRRDPIIKNAIDVRLHAIAGRNIKIEARSDRDEDKAAADIIDDLFRELGDWSMSRYRLAESIVDAQSYAWVTGRRQIMKAGSDEVEAEWWVPRKLKDIDERRLRWGLEDRKAVLQITPANQTGYIWHTLTDDDRRQLIHVRYEDSEGRLGYGRGLRDALYHYHWAKGVVLREGLNGLERWAQAWPVVKIDTKAIGDSSQTTDQIKSAYLDVFKKHRARFGAVVIDKEDEVEWPNASGTGHRMVTEFLNYLDAGITRVITGALLPSGGGAAVGSLARAKEEGDTAESLVQFDRGVLDEALTRDLVSLVWRMNRENLRMAGLGNARMPSLRTVNEKKEDTNKNALVIATLLAAGVPVKKEEVYQKTGLTMPAEGDEVIEGSKEPKDFLPVLGKQVKPSPDESSSVG